MQVATLLESAWEETWSEDMTAVLNVGSGLALPQSCAA